MANNGINHQHLDEATDSDTALKKIQTAGSISISPELFEKLYLQPQNQVKGDLRKTFGNPTPLAIGGFLLSLTPLTCDLMNFRGAAPGNGSASIGAYFFFGTLCMFVAAILEWILGNTFPATVFGTFGAFWGTFAATLIQSYDAYANYAVIAGDSVPADGLTVPTFYAAFGFFLVWMGVLCFVYLICALRTNLIFVLIFFCLIFAFPCLTAWFWNIADNAGAETATASRLRIAGGALAFVVCVLGWWIFTAILLASLDFPFQLPVFDLSHIVKGASEKAK